MTWQRKPASRTGPKSAASAEGGAACRAGRLVARFGEFAAPRRKGRKARAGSVAIVTAIAFPVMIGFVGLTIEVGMWLLVKRAMQGAADVASYSGAVALLSGSPNFAAQALAVAAQNGYTNGVDNITVTVNNPPQFGRLAGNADGVEVIIRQPQPRMISALLPGTQATTVAARSVTAPTVPGDILLALDSNASDTGISAQGNGTVTLQNAGFIDNASLNIQGSGTVNAAAGSIRGSVSLQGGAGAVLNPANPYVFTRPVPDPYANRPLPTPAACTAANTGVSYKNTTQSISPGTYCNGLLFDSNANITLNPGVYIIYGGVFNVRSNATVSGNGVTIVLTGSAGDGFNPHNYATANVSSTGAFNITAPATAPAGCSGCTGLAFFQDRNEPISPLASSSLGGNGSLSITGALDFPAQQLTYNGNGGSGSACTQIVAYQVILQGNGSLQDNCAGTGVATIVGPGQISVFE
ncbi:MAG TPA: pilus assembly protein TadG-related protein [Stellaceae bacterium]|nr:pilus assembly protein TadG-related protein [Stellaceae bacterium]